MCGCGRVVSWGLWDHPKPESWVAPSCPNPTQQAEGLQLTPSMPSGKCAAAAKAANPVGRKAREGGGCGLGERKRGGLPYRMSAFGSGRDR